YGRQLRADLLGQPQQQVPKLAASGECSILDSQTLDQVAAALAGFILGKLREEEFALGTGLLEVVNAWLRRRGDRGVWLDVLGYTLLHSVALMPLRYAGFAGVRTLLQQLFGGGDIDPPVIGKDESALLAQLRHVGPGPAFARCEFGLAQELHGGTC